jgi:signal transduction histidine kinase
MIKQVLHLLDPERRIRPCCPDRELVEIREYSTVEDFVRAMGTRQKPLLAFIQKPLLAFIDRGSDGGKDPDHLHRHLELSDHFFLIVVADRADGCRWLERGASDFVVLNHLNDELPSRVEAMLRRHRQILTPDFRNRAVATFIGQFLHDVRNPLNCIMGYLQILLSDPGLDCRFHDDLQQAMDNAEALVQMTGDLAQLSAEADQQEAHDR